jgi:hypothetical protein
MSFEKKIFIFLTYLKHCNMRTAVLMNLFTHLLVKDSDTNWPKSLSGFILAKWYRTNKSERGYLPTVVAVTKFIHGKPTPTSFTLF